MGISLRTRVTAYLAAGLLGYLALDLFGLVGGLIFVYLGFKLIPGHRAASRDRSRDLILIVMELSGRLAITDGYVSAEEISFTEEAIQDLQGRFDFSRSEAIDHFNYGKQADYPINTQLDLLAQYLDRNTSLLCLQLLVRLAVVDNLLSDNELEFLRYVGRRLSIPPSLLDDFLSQIITRQNQQAHYSRTRNESSSNQRSHQQRDHHTNRSDALTQAYGTLGVTSDDSDDDIRRNYRKLRSLYHPDKLQAKKIPQALIEEAERQIIEVNRAWDTIKQARNL